MQKAHLQVTGSEGASGIQTEDLKVEVQELGGGAGKQRIREKKMREKLKPLHAEPALGGHLASRVWNNLRMADHLGVYRVVARIEMPSRATSMAI
jgi:hypothetical protein